MKILFLLIVVLFTFSCGNDKPDEKYGKENEACYQDQTCDSGLLCVSSICIVNKCTDITCEEWEECSPSVGVCSVRAGRCNNSNDCDNATCNSEHRCVSDDICSSENCSNHGTCKVLNDKAVCVCVEGYNNNENVLECVVNSGDPCEGINCSGHGVCKNNTGEAICDCADDYEVSADKLHCDLIIVNPCEDVDCDNHGSCAPSNGSALCTCADDYEVSADKLHCTLIVVDPCEEVDCSGHGSCSNNNGSALCTCADNYKLVGTTTCVAEANPCEGHETCGGHGTCSVVAGVPSCTCTGDGYFPNEDLECVNPCEGHETCGGHGVCSATSATDASCSCTGDNYYENNDLECVNPCEGHETCDGHGVCSATTAFDASCSCTGDGYFPNDSLDCINPCDTKVCNANEECNPVDLTTATCDCVPQCTGKECGSNGCGGFCGSCEDNEECNDTFQCIVTCDLTCSNHGECLVNNSNIAECNCATGYTGVDCSTCDTGYKLDGTNCVLLCDGVECGVHGECTPDLENNEAVCLCITGYTGDNCESCATGYELKDGACVLPTIWCNLQDPSTINLPQHANEPFVFGQIYIDGITTLNTESTRIKSALGYKAGSLSDPADFSTFTWTEALFNEANKGDFQNNHEYMSLFPTATVGLFNYVYRFSLNATSWDDENATWVYCDLNGAGGVNNEPFDISEVGIANITEGTQTGSVFISEYIEGSSNNKAIEIYNATGAAVDLSNYTIKLATNGKTWDDGNTFVQVLSGTLENNATYLLVNTSAVAALRDKNDLIPTQVTGFNGDDSIGLFKDGVLIDVIGVNGVDPGTSWDVAGVSGATADHTLVRKSGIITGNTDWSSSAGTTVENSEWDVHEQNYFDSAGIR